MARAEIPVPVEEALGVRIWCERSGSSLKEAYLKAHRAQDAWVTVHRGGAVGLFAPRSGGRVTWRRISASTPDLPSYQAVGLADEEQAEQVVHAAVNAWLRGNLGIVYTDTYGIAGWSKSKTAWFTYQYSYLARGAEVLEARAEVSAARGLVEAEPAAEEFLKSARLEEEFTAAEGLFDGFFPGTRSAKLLLVAEMDDPTSGQHLCLCVDSPLGRREFQQASIRFLRQIRAQGLQRLYDALSVLKD